VPSTTKEENKMAEDIMDRLERDFEETISDVDEVDQKGLKTVAEIARKVNEKEKVIAEEEKNLKDHKKELLKLTDEDLPTMLAELGLTSFKLEDGSSISVKQTYGASIKVENRPAAFNWLRDNGYDDIIKNQITCVFGRGEDDKANSFKETAEKEGYLPQQKTEVHPQTLRAFVKERVENGEEFPMDLLGVYIGQRAVIRRGKS